MYSILPPSHCITSHGRNYIRKSKKRKLEIDLNVLLRVINRFIEDRIFVDGCRGIDGEQLAEGSENIEEKDLFIKIL